jgi:hypothetical protein
MPAALWAQYLEPGDIDIFIAGHETLDEPLEEPKVTLGLIVYSLKIKKVYDGFEDIFTGGMSSNALGRFQKTYREFLEADTNIPDLFEQLIGGMGFRQQGYQKYWTIGFGKMCLGKEEQGSLPEGAWEQITNLIDRNDIEILRSRIDDIRHF